eukprot:1295887-Amphidinium_carterae.2
MALAGPSTTSREVLLVPFLCNRCACGTPHVACWDESKCEVSLACPPLSQTVSACGGLLWKEWCVFSKRG